jgi:Chaperone for flagella basal body P-ring formation
MERATHKPAAPKHRVISWLLVLLVEASFPDARSASPTLRKQLVQTSTVENANPQHAARNLSRQEIFQAIHDDLARRGTRESGKLRPADLKIQLSVPVASKDAGLRVKEIGFDPIRHETIFELWTSKEPRLLPFHVATRWDPEALGLVLGDDLKPEERSNPADHPAQTTGSGTGGVRKGVTSTVLPWPRPYESAHTGQGPETRKVRPPTLAVAGRPATLIILGHNLRITTTVIPLQPGTKGQCIRVRDASSARVMTGEVVAEGLLQTSF